MKMRRGGGEEERRAPSEKIEEMEKKLGSCRKHLHLPKILHRLGASKPCKKPLIVTLHTYNSIDIIYRYRFVFGWEVVRWTRRGMRVAPGWSFFLRRATCRASRISLLFFLSLRATVNASTASEYYGREDEGEEGYRTKGEMRDVGEQRQRETGGGMEREANLLETEEGFALPEVALDEIRGELSALLSVLESQLILAQMHVR